MYDIFISYRRDGSFEMARLLYDHLRMRGLNVFFDLQELRSGKFNVKLYSAIDESSNFLLVLPQGGLDRCVNEDDWLRMEIEYAIEKNKNIVPLMMNGFDWPKDLPDSLKNLPLYNAVSMSREYLDASIERVLSMCVNLRLRGGMRVKEEDERIQNDYFSFDDEKERRRLQIQEELTRAIEVAEYEKIEREYDELIVLDLSFVTADSIMAKLENCQKVAKLIGIESDEKSVEYANERYGEQGKRVFYCMDMESEGFEAALDKVMSENGVTEFNVINLSWVLMNLRSPFKLLKILRKRLSKNGTVFVKDIDDAYNIAYPDENGYFERAVEICNRDELSGYRRSGRQVYTLLYRAGFKKTQLNRLCITTAEMDSDQRSNLFETYFSFVREDLRVLAEKYPDDKRVAADLEWYENVYDDMEELFQDDAFYFSFGVMLFTAKK